MAGFADRKMHVCDGYVLKLRKAVNGWRVNIKIVRMKALCLCWGVAALCGL